MNAAPQTSIDALIEALKTARSNAQRLICAQLIDALSNADRLRVRNGAILAGVKLLPRNLYFNYQTQTWID